MTLKTTSYKYLCLLFAILISLTKVSAQYASQEELKKAAETFFAEEDYIKALPLYSQLLSLYPKDPDYNYKYGACYFFGNREKEDALKYLTFATSKPNVNPQAFYFLALVQHHEYQFATAELNYKKFKEKGLPKDVQHFQVDRKIEMCRNGVTLLRSMTDIGVLQKKEIRATEFFRSYDLKGIGGKVVVKPDEFKTKLDVKKKESSIIHIGDNPKMVVFSSYGNDEKTGKDIFKVVKLPNGEWSSPSMFPDINTNFDDDYPFLHPDGKTLYFSSKGYNSMGGYDIFKSTFDQSTGKWSLPENLDFPINTPDDDILFISDIDNELAYFASSRASKLGELTVYKVQVDRQPSENTIIKGFFLAESNPNMKSATISILDVEKDRKYGVYTTNRESGEYLLVFPGNGGKFKLLVETTNSAPVHSAIIELPTIDGFRALKQELRLVGEGSSEKLVVKNLFDESDEFEITDPLIVQNLLKTKAKMDVNLSEEELSADNLNTTKLSTINAVANLNNAELSTEAVKNSTTLADNAKVSKNQANYSYDLAAQKSAEAKKLFNQSEQKRKLANESVNESEKQNLLVEAERLKFDAAKLVNEAVASLNMAKTLENEATERESDVKKSAELSSTVVSKINAGNRSEAEKAYIQLNEISSATYHKESALDKEKELIENKLADKEAEYTKVRNNAIELNNRQTELVEQIDALKDKISKTSKKADKEALQGEVNALTVDLEDAKYDLGVAVDNEKKIAAELAEIKNNYNTSSNVIESINSVNKLTVTKATDKTALNNDIAYFEQQGLVGLYPSAETETTAPKTSETFVLAEHKSEYSIISDEGKIMDYNSKHSSKIVDAQQNTSEYQKSLEMAKINQEWIADIDEEIEIREKQLASSTTLNEKTKHKSRIEVLNSLKAEKEKEAERLLLLAEEQKTSDDNLAINQPKTNANVENKSSNQSITDADGNIVDYASTYENELAQLDEKESSPVVIKDKIAVYKNWKNANEQELLLKKIDLNDAQGDDKIAIENRITELNDQIKSNEEYIALYTDKLPELEQNELAQANTTSSNTTSTNVTTTNTTSSNTVNNQYDENIILPNGEVADYSTDYNNQFSKADNIVDPLTSSREKEKITQNWINAVDQEIAYRNEKLTTANESEKSENARRIAELKSEKSSLVEQLSEIQTVRIQQENMLASTNTPKSNTNKTDVSTNSSTNVAPINNSVSSTAETTQLVDAGYNYTSEQAKKEIAQVTTLQEEVKQLNLQAEQKTTQAATIKNETQKQQLLAEATDLKTQAENKELEIAKAIEKSNKAEYYNNQAALSKVKQNSSTTGNNATIAELTEEESNTYFDKAQEEREKALNAQTNSAKQSSMAKAKELELTAIEKQRKAIELYSNQPADVAIASAQNQMSSTSNNAITTNSSSSLEIEGLTAEEKQLIARLTPQEIETIKASPEYVEYAAAKEESRRLVKEAEVDYVKSANHKEDANDQKILDGSLNKMASATTDEAAKTKLLGQIQKLATMIADNETKANEYNNQATEKQVKANESAQKADAILASSSKSEEIKTIEKAESINKDYLANALANNESSTTAQVQPNNVLNENSSNTSAPENEVSTTNKVANTTTNEEENITANNTVKTTTSTTNNEPVTNKVEEEVENNIAENTTSTTAATNSQPTVKSTATTNEENVAENNEENVAQNTTSNTTQSSSTTNQSTNLQEPLNNAIENSTTEENVVAENTVNNSSTTNQSTSSNLQESLNNSIENTTKEENVTANNNATTQQPKTSNTTATQPKTNTQQTPTTSQPIALNKIDEVPDVLTDQIFVLTPNKAPAYSADKKIPTASKLPEGLVFKVQIGAFRNPIPQDHFRGFAPIMAEDAGNGITRYTAGLFNTFNMANEAKNAIRTIGYPDAFVVAFYNGKRININEARAMAGGTDFASNETTTSTTNQTSTASNQANASNTTSNKLPEPKANAQLVEDGISTDVNKIQGVFFTVQVGVYSKPITADQLNNVTPLNSERTANGLIRYTSGVYTNLTDANAAKERVITLGITDAFVIAYANGNRVSVNDAVNFIAADNNAAATPKTNASTTTQPQPVNTTSSQPVNNVTEPKSSNSVSTANTTNENRNVTPTTQPEPVVAEPKTPINQKQVGEELNLEFQVLLGEYEEEVPVDEAAIYLKIYSKGVKIKEENNKTIYTIGSYPDYPSALDMQIEMKTEGVKKPKVIAFKNGTPIEVTEALELVKNNSK